LSARLAFAGTEDAMKFKTAALIVATCALVMGSAARADTLLTGVLAPDTVRLMCSRAGAKFFAYGADGYGCHNVQLMISCRPSSDCVSKVRSLNSYEGNPLAAYLRSHGMQQVDPNSQNYSD
jgi:hypothetical protein